jgi:hypothetical protein
MGMSDWIEIASKLPLRDAAYLLWLHKRELDRRDTPTDQQPAPGAKSFDTEVVRRAMQSAISSVTYERDHAEFGLTFDRMKAAHREVLDDDLRAAIRHAVKFWTDCKGNFSYSQAGLYLDAKRAVDLSLSHNPGFSNETCKVAVNRLCFEMR